MSGYDDFKYSFEINPIYLSGGITGGQVGALTPLSAYTEIANFPSGIVWGTGGLSLDDYFAHFKPLAGSSLIANQIGAYPFANQATAANAIITQPLTVSLLMICPVRHPGEYLRKASVMGNLKATLDNHIIAGGTFSIATPSFFYTDCLMVGMRDISGGETTQAQYAWQLDFQKPLISLQDAAQVQGALMQKISGGAQVNPNAAGEIQYSGSGVLTGLPGGGASTAAIPATNQSPGLGSGGGDNSVVPGVGG